MYLRFILCDLYTSNNTPLHGNKSELAKVGENNFKKSKIIQIHSFLTFRPVALL